MTNTDFMSVGTPASGTGTSVAVPVPAGTALLTVVEVDIYTESPDATITPPAGFTQRFDSSATNATTRGRLLRFWKRLSASDSGTYTFTWTTSALYEAVARAYKGIVTYGDPYDVFSPIAQSTSTLALSQAITSIAPVYAGGILSGTGTAHSTGSNPWTPPSGANERYDGNGHLSVWDEIGVSAGATGTRTATFTSNTSNSFPKGAMAVLGSDGFTRLVGISSNSGIGTVTTSFPAGIDLKPGMRMVIAYDYKAATAGVPTIDQGWTKVKEATGGTGTEGTDTGPIGLVFFAKDAVGSDVAPTITVGSPASNSCNWVMLIYAHGAEFEFPDAIGSNVGWISIVADTNTTTPLTATSGAFTNQPAAGDALAAIGAIPSDSNGSLSSSSISATGLSGGVIADANRAQTSSGSDSSIWWHALHQFTGTVSSGITGSFAGTVATNYSGLLAILHIRQRSTAVVTQKAGWGVLVN